MARSLGHIHRAVAAASLAMVAALVPLTGSETSACSGALVTFDEVNAEATRIVVGTVRAIRGDPGAPDGLAITVEAVVRGEAPRDLLLLPPTYMGCDGRIAEPVGTRLLIATGRQYFDANAPEDLHPYWLIGPGDVVSPGGVEDQDARHRTLDDLVTALGGDLVPVPAEDPAQTVDPPNASGDPGPSLVPLGALVVALFGGLALIARWSRSRRGDGAPT